MQERNPILLTVSAKKYTFFILHVSDSSMSDHLSLACYIYILLCKDMITIFHEKASRFCYNTGTTHCYSNTRPTSNTIHLSMKGV